MWKRAYLLFVIVAVSLVLWSIGEGAAFTLTVSKAGSGSGGVNSSPAGINCGSTCSADFNQGKKVTLKAKADSGSSFTGWSGGGCSGTKNCSVLMNADINVTATFEDQEQTNIPRISLSADSLDFGVVTPGQKVSRTLKISNIGTGDLDVTASVEGDYFSISGKSSFTVKPQKSSNLKVTFSPPRETGEELDSPDAPPVGGTVYRGQVEMETNDPLFPLPDVDLIADLNFSGQPEKIHITGIYNFHTVGVDFDLTEQGDIPLKILNNLINCGQSAASVCQGRTQFSSDGTINLGEAKCKLDGHGNFSYLVTGTLSESKTGKELKIEAHLYVEKDSMQFEACCLSFPCADFPYDSIGFMFAELQEFSMAGKLTCDFHFEIGETCTVPIGGANTSGSITFQLR